jgi:hypothetical protein
MLYNRFPDNILVRLLGIWEVCRGFFSSHCSYANSPNLLRSPLRSPLS